MTRASRRPGGYKAGMKRTTLRRLSLVALAAFGVTLIAGVFDSLAFFRNVSGKYLGYGCVVLAILGALGVNVWVGGPFG